jgi:predicted transcriptional regulator
MCSELQRTYEQCGLTTNEYDHDEQDQLDISKVFVDYKTIRQRASADQELVLTGLTNQSKEIVKTAFEQHLFHHYYTCKDEACRKKSQVYTYVPHCVNEFEKQCQQMVKETNNTLEIHFNLFTCEFMYT